MVRPRLEMERTARATANIRSAPRTSACPSSSFARRRSAESTMAHLPSAAERVAAAPLETRAVSNEAGVEVGLHPHRVMRDQGDEEGTWTPLALAVFAHGVPRPSADGRIGTAMDLL